MLKNAYFFSKFGADTAENEQNSAELLTKFRDASTVGVTFSRLFGGADPTLPARPPGKALPATGRVRCTGRLRGRVGQLLEHTIRRLDFNRLCLIFFLFH